MNVTIKGYGEISVQKGESYESVINRLISSQSTPIMAVRCNNILRELKDSVESDCDIELIDLNSSDGEKIYQRSLSFIMICAALEIFEDITVHIAHSLSKGLYCEFIYKRPLLQKDYQALDQRMREIILNNEPFLKSDVSVEDAVNIFKDQKMYSKVELMRYRDQKNVKLYQCRGHYNYFYGYMVPSAGYIQHFELVKYDEGVILMHPTKYSPNHVPEFLESPKIAEVFKESEDWGHIMEIAYVSNLNDLITNNAHAELIQIAEALQEKKIAQIADEITHKRKRVILIAGPSSSGKTTFANRLRLQLKVNRLHPITISTDNYFVDRKLTPRDERGEYDFESIDAVDVLLFNDHIMRLLDGESVDLPVFDFKVGKRCYRNEPIRIDEDQPIIIEGIHGLNEVLTQRIFKKDKFKIYISALTQLNIDAHNRIPTSQTRLIRRIVRDHQFRGHSASKTINMWHSVRRGEERNIFPFQEAADAIFNSALPYELSVLKKHAEPLLKEIKSDDPAYGEAIMLLRFLSYFKSIEADDLVPNVSILKEFIGGSGFGD